MKIGGCSREAEVMAAIRSGAWPAATDPGLRAHVDQCGDCGATAMVAQAMQREHAEALAAAPVAAPGAIWWRAQLRRRREAVDRAARPIVWAEVAAFVAMLAMAVFAVWKWVASAAAGVATAAVSFTSAWVVVSAGILALVAFAAVMLWFATADGE